MNRSSHDAFHPRKRVFVDRRVQGALIRLTVVHGVLYMLAIFLALYLWELVASGFGTSFREQASALWDRYGRLLLVVALLAPTMILGMIKMSHRFVGPILRLKRELRKLAAGEKTRPLQFRDNDYWQELAADFNLIAEAMGMLATQEQGHEPADGPDVKLHDTTTDTAPETNGQTAKSSDHVPPHAGHTQRPELLSSP